MNNGRYLTLMDLGRLDLVGRGRLMGPIFKNRWRPMVGSAQIPFRRALAPFQRFALVSRIVCWDAKWFFMEQRFEVGGQVVADAQVKGLFRGPAGNVPVAEIMAA